MPSLKDATKPRDTSEMVQIDPTASVACAWLTADAASRVP